MERSSLAKTYSAAVTVKQYTHFRLLIICEIFYQLGDRTSYHTVEGYDLTEVIEAFRDRPLYLQIHSYNTTYGKNFRKQFTGFIRNITFDNQVQTIDQSRLNGPLDVTVCPKDLIFSSYEGVAKLSDVTFDEKLRFYFEVKIPDCPECCSTSAILLSAIRHDSYFILEIVKGILYAKMKSQNQDDVESLWSIYNYTLCDGNWHKSKFFKFLSDFTVLIF